MGIEVAALVAAGLSAAATVYTSEKASDSAKKQRTQAKDLASKQEQEFNKLNGKNPDMVGLAADNAMSAKAGQSGTLLTGPAGVDPGRLLLGKSTLLGGG